MVLSSYPLQPVLYFKWVTFAEWIGIYHYCSMGLITLSLHTSYWDLFISKWYQNYQGNKFFKLTVGHEAIFQKSLADSSRASG